MDVSFHTGRYRSRFLTSTASGLTNANYKRSEQPPAGYTRLNTTKVPKENGDFKTQKHSSHVNADRTQFQRAIMNSVSALTIYGPNSRFKTPGNSRRTNPDTNVLILSLGILKKSVVNLDTECDCENSGLLSLLPILHQYRSVRN